MDKQYIPHWLPWLSEINIKQNSRTIVIVSGFYAPLHTNHIEMMESAKALGDELYVIVNNDKQLMDKKGFCFQNQKERLKIVQSLRVVDNARLSCAAMNHVGYDIAGICNAEYSLRSLYTKFIFANGGDRTEPNEHEKDACEQFKVEMVYNVGPPKTTSSSELIERAGHWYTTKKELKI